MDSIIEYAEKMGGYTFEEKPFNAVDSLILSQLSYLGFRGLVPGIQDEGPGITLLALPGRVTDQQVFYSNINPKGIRLLYLALISGRRFRDITVNYFAEKTDDSEEKQFAAACFFLNKSDAYVAFRGTDTTFVGWKEDFNMAFMDEIPSQKESRAYLSAVASRIPGNIIVGGHSKGGNLAVYSAVTADADIRGRIAAVYNHDGPGFTESFLNSSAFRETEHKIHTTLPRSSVVGMIFQQHETYKAVQCSAFGLFQHDGFSWNVQDGDFEYCEDVDFGASVTHRAISKWYNELDGETRKKFVEILYDILKSTNVHTMGELKDKWKQSALSILKYTSGLDKESKKFLGHAIGLMARYSVESAFEPKEHEKKKKELPPGKTGADC